MSLWQAVVPSTNNINYSFNHYVEDPKKYAETPYMPQLMAVARNQISKVIKAELRRKDQIKSAIVAHCIYFGKIKKGKDTAAKIISKKSTPALVSAIASISFS